VSPAVRGSRGHRDRAYGCVPTPRNGPLLRRSSTCSTRTAGTRVALGGANVSSPVRIMAPGRRVSQARGV